jgi:hypothetical protein
MVRPNRDKATTGLRPRTPRDKSRGIGCYLWCVTTERTDLKQEAYLCISFSIRLVSYRNTTLRIRQSRGLPTSADRHRGLTMRTLAQADIELFIGSGRSFRLIRMMLYKIVGQVRYVAWLHRRVFSFAFASRT